MKHEYKLHLIGILILAFCVSCGQTVKETVKPVVPKAASSGQFKRVVILPFADHTPASSLQDHCRRNVLVLEALQDALYQRGFVSAAEEDVVNYLMGLGVIQESGGGKGVNATAALEQELKENWSNEMKEELQEVIYQNLTATESDQQKMPIGMNRPVLTDLGDAFGADYIVRGRIIEFGVDQTDSFNPLSTGLLPFVFKSGHRTIFGVAESEGYERIDPELMEKYDSAGALFWGAGDFMTGLVGEKGGRVPSVTVQLRVLVQDARTGEVLWLNRAETSALPNTAFSDPDKDGLLATAVGTTVNNLVNDFADALAAGRVAKSVRKAPASEQTVQAPAAEHVVTDVATDKAEAAAEEAASHAREAADEAKVAAQESEKAKMFAQQAEDSAAEAKDAVKKASEATKKSEKIFEKMITK